jgi:hypothetical protein
MTDGEDRSMTLTEWVLPTYLVSQRAMSRDMPTGFDSDIVVYLVFQT